MKVLHLNTYNSGGAFRAGYRFHQEMKRQGISSEFVVLNRTATEPHLPTYLEQRGIIDRVNESIRYRLSRPYLQHTAAGVFSSPNTAFRIQNQECFKQADIIHLHWVAGFLDFPSFFHNLKKPVVWTIHDLNPLLGGLHYDFDADQLDSLILEEEIRRKHLKHKILKFTSRIDFIGPSKWIYQEAVDSGVSPQSRVHHIPYGIDCSHFKPLDGTALRLKHRIPAGLKVVLFVSESLEDKRKGLSILIESLKTIRELPVILITVGQGSIELDGPPVKNFGSITNQDLLTEIYSMADLFVIPSLQDNLPNTVIEAMACGTPAVGFAIGGVPDLIRPGQTGELAQAVDSGALVQAITSCLHDESKMRKMGLNARAMVEKEYNIINQTDKYIALYRSLM